MSNNRPHLNHVQLCPQCGGVALQGADSVLADTVVCEVCSYEGPRNSFPVHFFQTREKLDAGSLLQQMSDSLARTFMAAAGPAIGKWLHDWGFAYWDGPPRDAEDNRQRVRVMSIYARAMGKGMVQALLQARHEIEPLRVEHERKYRD